MGGKDCAPWSSHFSEDGRGNPEPFVGIGLDVDGMEYPSSDSGPPE